MDYLFIAGCPRSGTTALMDLLNADPRLALGRERYKKIVPTQAHFEGEHFLNPVKEETNLTQRDHYAKLQERVTGGMLRYIGDKTPGYYKKLSLLLAEFPQARFIITYRDPVRVANSFENRALRPTPGWPAEKNYQEGIEQWREALVRWRRFVIRQPGARLLPVKYEWFFCGDLCYLQALYNFLQLPLREKNYDTYFETVNRWNRLRKKELILDEHQLAYVKSNSDSSLLAWADRQALTALRPALQLSSEPEQAERFQRFSRFVLDARDQQLALTAGGGGMDVQPGLLTRELVNIRSRTSRLKQQIEARERSRWWRLGQSLHALIRGRKVKTTGSLVALADRIDKTARRALDHMGGDTETERTT